MSQRALCVIRVSHLVIVASSEQERNELMDILEDQVSLILPHFLFAQV